MARLQVLEKKLGSKSEEALHAEISELTEKLHTFRRAHGRFRERAHRAVDESIAAARAEFDRRLGEFASVQTPVLPDYSLAGQPGVLEHLGALAAVCAPAFADAWHAAVDQAAGFSPLTVAEFEAQEAKLEGEIRDREAELHRRRLDAERKAADQELAALESSLAGRS